MTDDVQWSRGATALTTSRPMRKGTLASCVAWVIGLPKADQRVARLLIEERPGVDGKRMRLAEIRSHWNRPDFPAAEQHK